MRRDGFMRGATARPYRALCRPIAGIGGTGREGRAGLRTDELRHPPTKRLNTLERLYIKLGLQKK